MTIRVVLGDDNVLVREGVRALLSVTDGIEVVGVAEDAPSLLAAAAEHKPDVVVTDIKMPPNFQLEGIECAHEIMLSAPQGLRASDVFMDEPSVMATENALMAAALVPGTTVIGNAASEPHVQDLARMLVKMGADIVMCDPHRAIITGPRRLR